MEIGFSEIGILAQIFGIGLLASASFYLNRIRIIFPRLFDEYKQDQLSENVKLIDHYILRMAQLLFFGGFGVIAGLLMFILSQTTDLVP